MEKLVLDNEYEIVVPLFGAAKIKAQQFYTHTGQPRYLKVQGNGENTSSYPKFDISKM